jgi:FkbM family methyltransferase
MRIDAKTAALGILLIAGGLAWRHWERIELAWIAVRGNSPHCPFSHAIQAAAHRVELGATKDRILKASRLLQEDPAGLELWDTPRGRFWIPKGDRYILPFNLAEQEVDIYTLDQVRLRPDDIVLDCGANVGVYTRKALEAGARTVVSIEPTPENVECLRRNFAREIEAGRVILVAKGVWDKEDVLTLHVDPQNTAAASFIISKKEWKDVLEVPLTTIDRLAEELKLPRVDFIKMDIEGAEIRALEGARQTITKHRPRLAISAYHHADHPAQIPATVLGIVPGYELFCGPCARVDDRIRPDVLLLR